MSLFLSESARRRLGLERGPGGRLSLDSLRAARRLALAMKGELSGAADLNALHLLGEIFERWLSSNEDLVERFLRAAEAELGRDRLQRLLDRFGREFGLEVGEPGAPAGPAEAVESVKPAAPADGRRLLWRDLLVFWWLRSNPAAGPLNELLDEGGFGRSRAFADADRFLRSQLAREPGLEAGHSSLLESLTAPFAAADSTVEQLRWILPRWRSVASDLEPAVEAGLDLAAEEEAPRFPPGPGPVELPSWQETGGERRYSVDRDWMPELVLVAKNCLVWLAQLGRRHDRTIERLDQIPEEALAELARQGFNGLWLIGLWERSPASQRIKRLCGNPQAEASAYSLRGYRIAERLGGEEALSALRRRAEQAGLRLAADMVPNHTGLDSEWVLEHPDRFIGQTECPFPNYDFEGPNLSADPRVEIRVEDRYFDRGDAAVVFQRIDRASGEVRFLYHGNDGTSMPWNDTAQLDYLQAETREAVLGQILEVARSFSIIRFDAAMTLTRQHFQRLWYPLPGDAGAIPSRADWSMTAERFDERMPREFWREVVERIEAEAPDTLLMAEAFWLLEGYFVRTLGMHRVYNSAFMHMMRDGDTAGYRRLMREVLEFDPAVLERFVNFMSNPDEATAVEQFGSGARYRGVCLLLATLPGLPMFAHGQVEGLAERYGMEYGRSYHEEQPDTELAAWHERIVAPILRHRRRLFAGAADFQLFDCTVPSGEVDEAVLAFTNGDAEERFLVVFNHSDRAARGRIRLAVPRADLGAEPVPGSERPVTAAIPLTEALRLDPTRQEQRLWDLLSDWQLGCDYRQLAEEGLELELAPYEFRLLSPAAPESSPADEAGPAASS